MAFFRFISEWINSNPGKAVGVFLGLLLGLFFVSLGFLKTLFIILVAAVGFLIGKLKDDNVSFLAEFKRLLKRGSKDDDENYD